MCTNILFKATTYTKEERMKASTNQARH